MTDTLNQLSETGFLTAVFNAITKCSNKAYEGSKLWGLIFSQRMALAQAAIAAMKEYSGVHSEMLLNFPMNATEFELFKSWKTTQGGNIDQTDYEAWKAGYRTALAGFPKREIFKDKCADGCVIAKAVKEFTSDEIEGQSS